MTSAYFVDHFLNIKKSWRCPSCENVTSRRKGSDTPVRHQLATSETTFDLSSGLDGSCLTVGESHAKKSDTNSPGAISYHEFAVLLDTKLETMKASLAKDIRYELSSTLEKLKSEFSATTDFLSAQICDLKKEVTSYKNKFNHLESVNLSLQKSINSLQTELNVKEQANLANDVQITGIPEFENESLIHVITTVAAKIGVKIEEQDIASTARMGPKRGAVDSSNATYSFRSRPIVVRLTRRSTRNELLKNARIRRGSTTGDLGLPLHEPKRFFINERLTKVNRQIFIKARDAARSSKWRYVWAKEGRIYARRSESSEVHLLQTEAEVENLFTGSSVTHSED
ncbi:jg2952 [Pararge aegeria aegeria]|uniref:Jg2952 protein n=1 Tax=Pararge aegeria aegeria TaxID=348720 RepID=A0A8S4QCY9_9NEOP|nr:jg2952 [Pararge aegeria aegeria]